MIRRTTLASGVRVITDAMPQMTSVSLGMWIEAGSVLEPAAKRGLSHLLEHMLLKGTRRRSAEEIARTFDDLGARLNAFTSYEHTCFHAKTLRRDLPVAIDVLVDMLLHATLDPEVLARERKVVQREIRMREDVPSVVLSRLYRGEMFGDSPLGEAIAGTAESVAAIGREDLASFVAERYRPNAVAFAAAGDCDHDEIVAALEAALATFGGAAPNAEHDAPTIASVDAVRVRAWEQAYVAIAAPGFRRGHPRRYAMRVLETVLGGGRSSRLYREIRSRRALAYGVQAFRRSFRHVGLCVVTLGTAPETVGECVAVVADELARLRESAPSEAEMRLAKRKIVGMRALSGESTSARMRQIGDAELRGRSVIDDAEFAARIEAVDGDDVRRLAAELFAPERLGTFVIGPVDPTASYSAAGRRADATRRPFAMRG